MHQLITFEFHWLIFAGIILLFLFVGLVRWFFQIDKPTNHKWNIFWLMLLLGFIITWTEIFCRP